MGNEKIKTKRNITWYGEAPTEWEFSKIGILYSLRNEKVSDFDYEPLSVGKMGVVAQLEDVAKTDAHDDRKKVCIGDFVINSRSDRRNACGISKKEGSVSLINIVLIPKSNMSPDYYNWLYHTEEFADEFYKWGHGITDDLWTTNYQDMKNIIVPKPKLDEQEKIANFLDFKCSKIDAAIEKLNKQIEVLKKYKQSVITEAVTKGLDNNVEMRESGVDWIGKIPKEWGTKRLKYLIGRHIGGSWGTDVQNNENDMICIRIADFEFDKMRIKENIEYTKRNYTDEEIKYKTLRYGDLLIEKSGGGEKTPVGRTVVYRLKEKSLFANFMDSIRLLDTFNFEYAKYVFYTIYNLGLMNLFFNQTTGLQNLRMQEYFNSVKMPLPYIKEQQQIADFLDSKCSKIDLIIDNKTHQIEVLEKYKKSLIYEYVTGKKRVDK